MVRAKDRSYKNAVSRIIAEEVYEKKTLTTMVKSLLQNDTKHRENSAFSVTE